VSLLPFVAAQGYGGGNNGGNNGGGGGGYGGSGYGGHGYVRNYGIKYSCDQYI